MSRLLASTSFAFSISSGLYASRISISEPLFNSNIPLTQFDHPDLPTFDGVSSGTSSLNASEAAPNKSFISSRLIKSISSLILDSLDIILSKLLNSKLSSGSKSNVSIKLDTFCCNPANSWSLNSTSTPTSVLRILSAISSSILS